MSCGNPHETPCDDVLASVFDYLDGEIDHEAKLRIRAHLDECGPCLKEYGLEEAIKVIVRRSCSHEDVPVDLRDKVLAKIALARMQMRQRQA